MKKPIVYSLLFILFSLASPYQALAEGPDIGEQAKLPAFMEKISPPELFKKPSLKFFFISPEDFWLQLEKIKPEQKFYLVYQSEKSYLNKIIFTLLQKPEWNRLELKHEIYSKGEFKTYLQTIEKQGLLKEEKAFLKRDIVKITLEEFAQYVNNWTDTYLQIEEKQKNLFLEEALSIAKEASFIKDEQQLYLLLELIILKLEKI